MVVLTNTDFQLGDDVMIAQNSYSLFLYDMGLQFIIFCSYLFIFVENVLLIVTRYGLEGPGIKSR